ncbi:PHA/PHB synthase family protein [Dichotomicrobium thermohalophilum]|uniref:Polyhydroxyalkanoate synthase n=1 Tax=Dichotomicrobium thermohalophilum TaxID=933063 RepID=A0A397Q5I2_9HYPH|nr:alpha/beta fold hydrolase [Dichotomicrobium thermohalophilum]RIA55065.1 polyhydroxyalkanoate synthase [Dichotomicrobium thermohalophilum]
METRTDTSTALAPHLQKKQDLETVPGGDERLSTAAPEFLAEERFPFPRRTTHALDRAFKAHLARMSFSISPAALASDTFTWLAHLAISPGKALELYENAMARYMRFLVYIPQTVQPGGADPCFAPLSDADDRFDGEDWQKWPFNIIHQWFLLNQEFWHDATNDVDGVPPHKEKALSFVARQVLDHFAPTNFVLTNPEVLRTTMEEGGTNFMRGAMNAMEDWSRFLEGRLPVGAEKFKIGEDLAATEGKVVYRNHLIELIQYTPKTDKVRPEPILITPAWIMKYYILDLSPDNSLVKYLVEQGYTVFMISWRNPTAEDRDLDLNDYIDMGFFAALRAVNTIVPDRKVHAMGYCLGGTLLTMAASAMARDDDERLQTITLLAAQTDFTEAGEIMLFVSESQVSYLEGLMWDQGYLDSHQMTGAFQMLQSNDLIWSRYIREYLLGRRGKMIDLMAWNADATRMPYKMHSEYLRKLFLYNELAQGRFEVDGEPVSLTDIRQPIFCVSTTRDHVAPWRSVYKIHLLVDTNVTFVLANRGHNGGIVSEPGHKGREYQIRRKVEGTKYIPPDEWRETTPVEEGSWWPALVKWLDERSGDLTEPPTMGASSKGYAPITDAPGTYVHQR